MQVRKVIVTALRNGALLHTRRLIHRGLKAQIHEETTKERLISHAISDPSVKGGAEGAATVSGATGVGATGAGATGAGPVVALGAVEEMERGRPNHILTATRFLEMSHAYNGAIHCFYRDSC